MVDIVLLYIVLGFLFAALVALIFYLLRFMSRREEIVNARYENLLVQLGQFIAKMAELTAAYVKLSETLREMELHVERLETLILTQARGATITNTNTNTGKTRRGDGIDIRDADVAVGKDLLDGNKTVGRDESGT